MEHVPTNKESDVEKVYRIARGLGISLEEAADTCDAFHLAFSDEGLKRSIFGMIDQLDGSAWKKGEPMGLIIRYTVELGMDGIRVGRYADEIPPGEVVSLTPRDRAEIFLKIKDNFPTQEFLGPVIVNRPELESVPGAVATGLFSDEVEIANPESGISFEVCSDSEITECGIRTGLSALEPETTVICLGPSSLESATAVICLGPIRLNFHERFPIVSATGSKRSGRMFSFDSSRTTALEAHYHLPPWAALQAGTPAFQSKSAFQSVSGLSPPPQIGERGHSVSKDVPRPLAIDVETCVSHLDI